MFRECLLGDIVTLKRGYDLPAQARRAGPVPIVSSSGITGTHSEAKVKGPGVITGRYGTLGEIHYLTEDFWPLNTTLYVRDFKGNDPRFVAYLLRTLDFASRNAAAAVPGVNRNDLHRLPVSCPDPNEQRRIASILSAYDDLVENNTRRIAILEELARRIYEEWFVRFRFPGHESVRMVECELGLLPAGWSNVSLGSVANIQWGDTSKTKASYVDEGYSAYSASGRDGRTATYAFDRDGIVLSAIGARCGLTWYARGKWSCIKNTIRFWSTDTDRMCDEFLFLATGHPEYWPRRGAAQPFISLGDAKASPVILPPKDLMRQFKTLACPMLELVDSLTAQGQNLRATRDLLLQKLISGELDVSMLPEPQAAAA